MKNGDIKDAEEPTTNTKVLKSMQSSNCRLVNTGGHSLKIIWTYKMCCVHLLLTQP